MAYGLTQTLLLAGITYALAYSQSGYDDNSEMLGCRLSSRLKRVESNADAYIGVILDHEDFHGKYDGTIPCRLEDKGGRVHGYVPFAIVILHDPPTELTVSIPMTLRAKLKSLTMICDYADISSDLHVHNEIPSTVKRTKENGEYQCDEGTAFKIVLTGLFENSAKPRLKRMTENIICSRFGARPDQDIPENRKKVVYCHMYNGTAGVYMYTENGTFECSRCCENHFFNKKPLKLACDLCPPHSHKEAYNYFGDCLPGALSDYTQPSLNPQSKPSLQFMPANRTTTSIYVKWVVSGESSLIDHYQVLLERESFVPITSETKLSFLNITGLIPDTSYNVTVTAVYEGKGTGEDLKSNVLMVQTLFEIPPVEDFDVKVSKGEALVTWTSQPGHELKLILNYSREESKVPCDEDSLGYVVLDSSGRFLFKLSCEGLFILKAHYYDPKYKRHGPESGNLKFTVKQKPKFAPKELVVEENTTSALVTWNQVQSTQQNPIIRYTLYYKKYADAYETTPVHTKDNKTSWELESLTSNTKYEVSVAAVNSEGEGPRSQLKSFQTLFVIPNITDVSVCHSDNKIYLSWKPQKKFDVELQITCTIEGGKPQVWSMKDELGKFDFDLESYGKYDILVQYYDNATKREGPPAYDETIEYSGVSVGTIIAIVTVILILGIIAFVIFWNRSKLSSHQTI